MIQVIAVLCDCLLHLKTNEIQTETITFISVLGGARKILEFCYMCLQNIAFVPPMVRDRSVNTQEQQSNYDGTNAFKLHAVLLYAA